jgi:hypothetical protein
MLQWRGALRPDLPEQIHQPHSHCRYHNDMHGHPSLQLMIAPCLTPETGVPFMSIARWVFRQLILRFWIDYAEIGDVAHCTGPSSLQSKPPYRPWANSRHGGYDGAVERAARVAGDCPFNVWLQDAIAIGR